MKVLSILLTALFINVAVLAQTASQPKLLRHVVVFSFKKSSSADDIKKVAETFAALHGKVPQIKAFEWGVNMSPEKLNPEFTHCFILTFHSEKDLADYQEHPAHRDFQKVLKPHMDKVFVVDYFVN